MFKISSETELLGSFRAHDRESVDVPLEFKFPLVVKDYLTWLEPSGNRVYLVFKDRPLAQSLGVVFRRDQGTSSAATMCEWCHCVRDGGGVGLLMATASSKTSIGIHLCRDLSCKEKVRATPGVHDYPPILDEPAKIRKIISRMADFARRELF